MVRTEHPLSLLAVKSNIYIAMLTKLCSMLHDIEHLVSKLGKVSGFGDLGMHLMKIVEHNEIKVALPILNEAEVRARPSELPNPSEGNETQRNYPSHIVGR